MTISFFHGIIWTSVSRSWHILDETSSTGSRWLPERFEEIINER